MIFMPARLKLRPLGYVRFSWIRSRRGKNVVVQSVAGDPFSIRDCVGGMCGVLLMWVVEFGKGIVASRGQAGLFELFHEAHAGLCFCWVLAVTFLMMGGLLQEKVVGASAFTLGLPVSRLRLMSVRFGMGFVQAIALAVFPWIGMLAYGKVAGYQYPFWQVCFHVFLLLSGGVVFLTIAFLISSVVEGQYTAPVVSIGVSAVLVYALRGEKLAALQSREIHGGLRWVFVANGTSDWTRPVVARGRVWCRRRVIVYDFCQGNRTL